MQAPTTADAFLDLCGRSGLVTPSELETSVGKLRAAGRLPEDPEEVARFLSDAGILTPFQTKLLLQGKWKAFSIGSDYLMVDQLGAGGMGTVYLCRHRPTGDLVALKILPAEQAESAASLERFRREARAVAALNHPNIVCAIEAGTEGKQPFLSMEFVDGINLQDFVTRRGPQHIGRACDFISQAALGLQHAHEAGLIHRDIKPANLLLARDGAVKLLDLGLARFYHDEQDDLTRRQHGPGGVLGTADYVAPEQAVDARAADIRSDIYALGCTLWFLLTGEPPFPGGQVGQKLIAHQMKPFPSLRMARPDAPPGLEEILYKMTAKDKKNRYQQPVEVADALAPYASPPTPPQSFEMPPTSVAVRRWGRAVPLVRTPPAIRPSAVIPPPPPRPNPVPEPTATPPVPNSKPPVPMDIPAPAPFGDLPPEPKPGGGGWAYWAMMLLLLVVAVGLAAVVYLRRQPPGTP